MTLAVLCTSCAQVRTPEGEEGPTSIESTDSQVTGIDVDGDGVPDIPGSAGGNTVFGGYQQGRFQVGWPIFKDEEGALQLGWYTVYRSSLESPENMVSLGDVEVMEAEDALFVDEEPEDGQLYLYRVQLYGTDEITTAVVGWGVSEVFDIEDTNGEAVQNAFTASGGNRSSIDITWLPATPPEGYAVQAYNLYRIKGPTIGADPVWWHEDLRQATGQAAVMLFDADTNDWVPLLTTSDAYISTNYTDSTAGPGVYTYIVSAVIRNNTGATEEHFGVPVQGYRDFNNNEEFLGYIDQAVMNAQYMMHFWPMQKSLNIPVEEVADDEARFPNAGYTSYAWGRQGGWAMNLSQPPIELEVLMTLLNTAQTIYEVDYSSSIESEEEMAMFIEDVSNSMAGSTAVTNDDGNDTLFVTDPNGNAAPMGMQFYNYLDMDVRLNGMIAIEFLPIVQDSTFGENNNAGLTAFRGGVEAEFIYKGAVVKRAYVMYDMAVYGDETMLGQVAYDYDYLTLETEVTEWEVVTNEEDGSVSSNAVSVTTNVTTNIVALPGGSNTNITYNYTTTTNTRTSSYYTTEDEQVFEDYTNSLTTLSIDVNTLGAWLSNSMASYTEYTNANGGSDEGFELVTSEDIQNYTMYLSAKVFDTPAEPETDDSYAVWEQVARTESVFDDWYSFSSIMNAYVRGTTLEGDYTRTIDKPTY